MKKLPTLFERVFENGRIVDILPNVLPELEWVLKGEGVATIKWDGSCCAVIDGVFYKRYDAKRGKMPPADAIPCSNPDPVTGHWPHWVPVTDAPEDKWFRFAYEQTGSVFDGTYEAVGPHFNGNPYRLERDGLIQHGQALIVVERSFEGIKKYLEDHNTEGIVFWKDGEPQCKIKRSDFGFEWKGY